MKEVLSRNPCNHKCWVCLNVEPKASFNCAGFPPLIFNGRHSHLRTLEADIKGWILPPILTLVCIKLSGNSGSQGGCLCAGARPVMCREAGPETQCITGLGRGVLLVRFFRICSRKLYLLVMQWAQMLWMSGGKGGEIVSPSLFLLHANKCSYRWKFTVNGCSSKSFCMLVFLKWNNSPGKLCVTYTDPKEINKTKFKNCNQKNAKLRFLTEKEILCINNSWVLIEHARRNGAIQ